MLCFNHRSQLNFVCGLFAHSKQLSCAKVLVSRCPVWILTSIQVEVEVDFQEYFSYIVEASFIGE